MSVDDRLRLAFAGMHPIRRAGLLEKFGTAADLLHAIETGAVSVPGHARAAAGTPASDRWAQLKALGIEAVFREDVRYPSALAVLPDAPDVLFVRGMLPLEPGVAVVGTRRASQYGRRLARSFGSVLAEAGRPVISGLARGIDGCAHRGVVAAGGVGVAVLGCGPDVWYPLEHRSLGEALLEGGGAVLSEYPPGAPPLGWRFPPRNRVISGLSAAVVVVEATRTGGALITARAALDQGRDVLAVPGDVDRVSSEGCNLLIRDGAIPVLGGEDLIEAVALLLGPSPRAVRTGGPESDEDPLVAALGPLGRSFEWLAVHLRLPIPELLARVAGLETQGKVTVSGDVVVRA